MGIDLFIFPVAIVLIFPIPLFFFLFSPPSLVILYSYRNKEHVLLSMTVFMGTGGEG